MNPCTDLLFSSCISLISHQYVVLWVTFENDVSRSRESHLLETNSEVTDTQKYKKDVLITLVEKSMLVGLSTSCWQGHSYKHTDVLCSVGDVGHRW